ncbi:MAG: cytochrome C [Candidatus Hydrogenedentes bacterium]|nr:cytochrome C [Candidatus Hydrogenedentota bacterium]
MTDANFQTIVLKPDNVPIVALVYLTLFFLWFTQKQARDNDHRILAGQPPNEHADPREKVLVWPDLVYIELIALVLVSVLLIVWSLGLKAPLEEPANPTFSPNPSKAPWYFLGLQEMLVYFDPWIAGVVLPTIMVLGLMSFPFLDNNPRGQGYYCFRERKMAVSLFLFCWLLLWIFLIITGTFLRGPNWNLFGPFEAWDIHKLVPLNNINLSEYVFMIWLKTGVPESVLVREIWGILIILFYFLLLPPLLAKTVLRKLHAQLGNLRYSVFIVLVLVLLGVPIKMYLRWIFNLKYIVAIPEYFFNI